MNFLAKRAFTVLFIVAALAFGVAYTNGAFLIPEEQGPRFGRAPDSGSPSASDSFLSNGTSPLSDNTAEQLQSLGFQIVEPKESMSFSLPNLKGQSQSFNKFRGKLVVLNFWATWCPPCQKEMPSMERLWSDYRDRNIVVLALNMREDRSKINSFVESYGLSFPVWIDDGAIASRMRVSTLPTTWLVGPKGRTLARLRGPIRWDKPSVKKALESILEDMEINAPRTDTDNGSSVSNREGV
jgi:thiol-disulfide isomerase/thioredoxin